jgi:sodium transport system permease protein
MTSWLVGGGMSLILDTTVGEKERQTIETLLVTPASRTGIVMGKMTVVFTSLMAVMGLWLLDVLLLNALSTAGPALVALELLGPGQTLEILVKSSSNALVLVPALLALLIPFAVMLNGIVMAGSAMAANYREASLFLALIQLGLPAVVLLTVFSLPARLGILVYAVPFFGTIAAIRDLFANTLSALGLLINFVSALISTAGIIGLVTWLFDQEWSTTRGL